MPRKLMTFFVMLAALGAASVGATPLSDHGRLHVCGTTLCGESGETVQLRGLSSHGLQWGTGAYVNASSIAWIASDWKANLIRGAMYTAEGGYGSNPSSRDALERKLDTIVTSAEAAGIYAIIDWHILQDNTPLTYQAEAVDFFSRMAAKYAGKKHVLYEICNEPNNVSWADIKTYANAVIPAIRAKDPNAVVLVGTPTWSQDVDVAAASPLAFSNIMYSLHFYAGSHGESLRNKALTALAAGAPLFVTEWGTTAADGGESDPNIYTASSNIWLDFLDAHNISWANWSLANYSGTSGALASGASFSGSWPLSALSTSGQFVRTRLRTAADPNAAFALSATSSAGGSVSYSPVQASYAKGSVVTLTATPDIGYYFAGWSGGSNSTVNPLTVTMGSDLALKAEFLQQGTNPNLARNGDFSAGKGVWSLQWYEGAAGTATFTDSTFTAVAKSGGTAAWNIQFSQTGISLVAGSTYELLFDIRASHGRTINPNVGMAGSPYTSYAAWAPIAVSGGSYETKRLTFTMNSASDADARLEFNLGTDTGTVQIRNVILRVVGNPVAVKNVAPAFNDSTVFVARNGRLGLHLWATDAVGRVASYALAALPANGTLAMVGSDSISYAPVPGFSGSDLFTVTATDDSGASTTATVKVNVALQGDSLAWKHGNGTVVGTRGVIYSYNDVLDHGTSTSLPATYDATVDSMAANDGVLPWHAALGTTPSFAYAGMAYRLDDEGVAVDVSRFSGIQLTYSSTRSMRFNVRFAAEDKWDHPGTILASTGGAWKTVTIPWSSLTQFGWGTAIAVDPTSVRELKFQYQAGVAGGVLGTTNDVRFRCVGFGNACSLLDAQENPVKKDSALSVLWKRGDSTAQVNNRHGFGFVYTDVNDTGTSVAAPNTATLDDSIAANAGLLTFHATLGTKPLWAYAAVGLGVANVDSVTDASRFSAFQLVYKATHPFKLQVKTSQADGNDHPLAILPATSGKWDTVSVPFSTLKQEGWGTRIAFDPALLNQVMFQFQANLAGSASGVAQTMQFACVGFDTACSQYLHANVIKTVDTVKLVAGFDSLALLQEFTDKSISLSGHFKTTGTLGYRAVSVKGLVTPAVSAGDLVLSSVAGAAGRDTVKVTGYTLTDSVTASFPVRVYLPAAPKAKAFASVVRKIGAADTTVSFAGAFTGSSYDLTLAASSRHGLVSATLNGTDLVIHHLSSVAGSDTIDVTATEQRATGRTVTTSFSYRIKDMAVKPVLVTPFPTLALAPDFGTYKVPLTEHFSSVAPLGFFWGCYTKVTTCSLNKDTLVINSIAGVTGVDSAVIKAYESDYPASTYRTTFKILVQAEAAPYRNVSLPNEVRYTDAADTAIDLSAVFGSTTAVTYAAQSLGTAAVSVRGTNLVLASGATKGLSTIIVSAKNSAGTTYDTFTVRVKAKTDAPVLSVPFQTVVLAPDFGTYKVPFAGHFTDVAPLNYYWGCYTKVTTCSLNQDTLVIKSVAGVTGIDSAVVKAYETDFPSSTNRTVFKIMVQASTKPVLLSAIPNEVRYKGAVDTTLDLTKHFSGTGITYTVTSTGTSVANVSGTNLTLSTGSISGISTAVVTATTSAGSVSSTFTIRVKAKTDAPVLVTPFAELVLTQDFGTYKVPLAPHFTDATPLGFFWGCYTKVTTCSLNKDTLVIKSVAGATGIDSAVVKAYELDFSSSTNRQTFRIRVQPASSPLVAARASVSDAVVSEESSDISAPKVDTVQLSGLTPVVKVLQTSARSGAVGMNLAECSDENPCQQAQVLLPSAASLSVDIYDQLGTKVISWAGGLSGFDFAGLPATTDGRRSAVVSWNLQSSAGVTVGNGVYFWKVRVTDAAGRETNALLKMGVTR